MPASNHQDPASDRASPHPSSPRPPTPTGLSGLDAILRGGLPAGRPSLLRGSAGTGKTVIALSFLCHGIAQGETGVFVTFDESPEALLDHAEGFGFPARADLAAGRLRILDMRPQPNEVQVGETIELTAILARIGYALDRLESPRLVLDAIDALESGFADSANLRAELTRVFDWIRERAVTCILTTGEQAEFSARYGLEDYIADCVIALRQDVKDRIMTRVLRIVKRRGGGHGANEYPFLLDSQGIFLIPVTGTTLQARVSSQRLPTGIPGLDAMLGGGGPYAGSTILISGQAGTGKTSISSSIARAVCDTGQLVLYISFEESMDELIRNQGSIGIDLARYSDSADSATGCAGTLVMQPVRAVEFGLEEHLMRIIRSIRVLQPALVILDPVSSLSERRDVSGAKEMLLRLLYLIKEEGVTTLATELLSDDSLGVSHLDVSSMIDVWIKLRRLENDGEMNRLITVIKARGLPISDQVKEFRITPSGLQIIDPYMGEGGIVYGTARIARLAEDEETLEQLRLDLDRAQQLRREIEEIAAASERLNRAERDAKAADLDRQIAQIESRLARITRARAAIKRERA
ncbi:circadian clock protein KaiC [Thiocapsa imhoffii]|uniref:non-specific serine/threonine protein kinase n=1 Tax=Thiocapsa imhoffii TaxID=382777 RepID=A0A9X0WLL1_9GAMM|nr:circadian clock protein KaiC [Thiocapsa imhoffii]MBK1646635.1 circadian clock protein KaiC [Thiocapsa imhoffii]